MTIPATHRAPGSRPVVLFVLGMPRSGTSALTRVLSLCGGALPPKLERGDSGNPLGYFEPSATHRINGAILHRHGSSATDPSLRVQEDVVFGVDEKARCIASISEFLSTLPTAPVVVIKDLHVTLLSDIWFEATRQAGFDIAVVNSVRHPQEAISSFAARRQVSLELAAALWLKFNLLSERHTRAIPRVFVEYADLLENWSREIKRVSATLKLNLNTNDENAVEEFLRQDLRRQRQGGPVTEPFGTDWFATVYGALHAAARDERWDQSALDRVFEAYYASERVFRTAFEDFHEDVREHLPPRRGLLLRLFRRAVIIEVRRLGDR